MDAIHHHPVDEAERLQHYIDDLAKLIALPAIRGGGDSPQILRTLLDAIVDILRLDFIYMRLRDTGGVAPIETLQFSATLEPISESQRLSEMLRRVSEVNPNDRPPKVIVGLAGEDVSLVVLRLGKGGQLGEIVAGSRRVSFPDNTERVVLGVAANQTAIAIQGALDLGAGE